MTGDQIHDPGTLVVAGHRQGIEGCVALLSSARVSRAARTKGYTGMKRVIGCAVALGFAAGCSSGPPSPPVLAYGMPSSADAVYSYGDTTVVEVNALGQRMELGLRGSAVYDVRFSPASNGVDVRMSVRSLSASVMSPMGSPPSASERDVDGELVFSLDRLGNATVVSEPVVSEVASQVASGLVVANGFFPGLPGRTVMPGESWVDTISYTGSDAAGSRTEHSIFRYSVRGDSIIAGRAYLAITLDGTSEVSNEMDLGGMAISQSSEVVLEGLVLWDVQNNRLFEASRSGTGRGTVSVPVAPIPLPIEISTTQRARLQGN